MTLNCFYCLDRLDLPRLNISLIGSSKKDFKKDTFDFCTECFEYLFGNVYFHKDKQKQEECILCMSRLIRLPYSYFVLFDLPKNPAQVLLSIRKSKNLFRLFKKRFVSSNFINTHCATIRKEKSCNFPQNVIQFNVIKDYIVNLKYSKQKQIISLNVLRTIEQIRNVLV